MRPALITFILDESGSMSPIAQSARDGFNDYLQEQTSGPDPTLWTLTTFANRPRTRFAVLPGHRVRPLGADYSPGGVTALYDAVGSSIEKTNRYLATTDDPAPSDLIVVILTDGLENASRRYHRRDIVDMIARAEDRGWKFVFLGADQDSWAVSQHLGITKGFVVDWSKDAASCKRSMAAASAASWDFRVTKSASPGYFDGRS